MHDLERRAQQLVRDWQALRRGLERVRTDQRVDPLYHVQLDAIEASIGAVSELADYIMNCTFTAFADAPPANRTPATTLPYTLPPPHPSGNGLAARIRRTRQAVEDIDMDAWP